MGLCTRWPPPSTGRVQQGPGPICVVASWATAKALTVLATGRVPGASAARWEAPTSKQTHSLCPRPGLQRTGLHTPQRGVSACLSLAAHPWDCPGPSLSPCRHAWQHKGQKRAGLCPVDTQSKGAALGARGSVKPRVRDRNPQPVQPGLGGQAALPQALEPCSRRVPEWTLSTRPLKAQLPKG